MQVVTGKLYNSGLDWITLSQVEDESQRPPIYYTVGKEMTKNLGDEGRKDARFGGYKGFSWLKGRVKIGQRERDGKLECLVVGTGHYAAMIYEMYRDYEMYNLKNVRVTRLDEQVTIHADVVDEYLLSDHYDVIRQSKACGNSLTGRRKATLYRSEGGETLYVGSRSSKGNLYRMYDKSSWVSGAAPGQYYRFEVERGRATAQAALDEIRTTKEPAIDRIARMSHEFLVKTGLTYKTEYKTIVSLDPEDTQRLQEASDTEARIAWLRKCVRRPVKQLLSQGKEVDVLVALGLDKS